MHKSWRHRLAGFSTGASLLIFAGCASGPRLEDLPRSQIDRPYTLPQGVASWQIPAAFGRLSSGARETTLAPIPIPLFWTQSLGDDWNLLWVPLPLGVAYQIHNDESLRAGATLFSSFGYGSIDGFFYLPTLNFSVRPKFSKSLALDLAGSFSPEISHGPYRWGAGAEAGPFFQLTEAFYLRPRLGFSFGRGREPSAVLNEDLPSREYSSLNFSGDAGISLSRQWDVDFGLHIFGITGSDNLSGWLGSVTFTYFW